VPVLVVRFIIVYLCRNGIKFLEKRIYFPMTSKSFFITASSPFNREAIVCSEKINRNYPNQFGFYQNKQNCISPQTIPARDPKSFLHLIKI
jgi:hypothetical protein